MAVSGVKINENTPLHPKEWVLTCENGDKRVKKDIK